MQARNVPCTCNIQLLTIIALFFCLTFDVVMIKVVGEPLGWREEVSDRYFRRSSSGASTAC